MGSRGRATDLLERFPIRFCPLSLLVRHAGLDPASRLRPDESREPSQRVGPGFHREPWIPAFAAMTEKSTLSVFGIPLS